MGSSGEDDPGAETQAQDGGTTEKPVDAVVEAATDGEAASAGPTERRRPSVVPALDMAPLREGFDGDDEGSGDEAKAAASTPAARSKAGTTVDERAAERRAKRRARRRARPERRPSYQALTTGERRVRALRIRGEEGRVGRLRRRRKRVALVKRRIQSSWWRRHPNGLPDDDDQEQKGDDEGLAGADTKVEERPPSRGTEASGGTSVQSSGSDGSHSTHTTATTKSAYSRVSSMNYSSDNSSVRRARDEVCTYARAVLLAQAANLTVLALIMCCAQRQRQRELLKGDERTRNRAIAAEEGMAQARIHRMAAPKCGKCTECDGYELDKVLVWLCSCGHHRHDHDPEIGLKQTALMYGAGMWLVVNPVSMLTARAPRTGLRRSSLVRWSSSICTHAMSVSCSTSTRSCCSPSGAVGTHASSAAGSASDTPSRR